MYLRMRSYKTGKKINKRFIIFISACAVFLLALIGIIILVTSGSNLKENLHKAPFSAQHLIIPKRNGIIYTDQDNLNYTDYLSKQIWSKKMFAQNLNQSASDDIIAVYNKTNVQLFDMSGNQLFTKEVTGKIINVSCGINKIAVITEVQTEEEGLKKFLTVYNTKGEVLDTKPFSTQNIIDAGFYGKNSKLWVLTLDTDGVLPISRIATYDPGKSQTGGINIYGQLIEKLIIDENNIYASGTTNLYTYSIFGEKKDSILIYGWNFEGQYFSKNKPVFLYVPREQKNKTFDSIRLISTENSDLTINLPPDVIKATIFNDKIYCFSKTNIYKYSLTGKREAQFELPYSIDSVSKVFEKNAFLVKGNDIFILALP